MASSLEEATGTPVFTLTEVPDAPFNAKAESPEDSVRAVRSTVPVPDTPVPEVRANLICVTK